MLCAMYRYEPLSGTWNGKKVESEFLDLRSAKNFITKGIVKRDILNKYNIVDRDSCLLAVEKLFNRSATEDPEVLMLYQIWNRYDETLDKATVEHALNEEFDFNDIVSFYCASICSIIPYQISADKYVETLKENLISLLESERIDFYIEFFRTYNWLFRLVDQNLFLGFDVARSVQIITQSHTAGFIEENECNEFLNKIGHHVEKRFVSWEQYLGSCILGKIYNLFAGSMKSLSVLKQSTFINAIYGIANAQNEFLKDSNLWATSDLKGFAKELDSQFHFGVHEDESYLEDFALQQDEVDAISLFKKIIFEPAIELGVGCYFATRYEKGNFYHPLMAVGKRFIFWDVIARRNQKFSINTTSDELPFLMTNQATFTNKAVYIFERKILIKRDLIPFKWEDVKFTFKVGYSCEFINVYINGHKVGYLPLYPSRVGILKDIDMIGMKDTRLNAMFEQEEFPRLEKLFNGILNRL